MERKHCGRNQGCSKEEELGNVEACAARTKERSKHCERRRSMTDRVFTCWVLRHALAALKKNYGNVCLQPLVQVLGSAFDCTYVYK
jgi:hypothetical protein